MIIYAVLVILRRRIRGVKRVAANNVMDVSGLKVLFLFTPRFSCDNAVH